MKPGVLEFTLDHKGNNLRPSACVKSKSLNIAIKTATEPRWLYASDSPSLAFMLICCLFPKNEKFPKTVQKII